MLFVIDVGNTNTVLGVFDGEELVHDWRIRTVIEHTVDEYGMLMYNLYKSSKISSKAIQHIIISCVVPPLQPIFERTCEKLLRRTPLIVGPGIRTGMPIRVDNPREVGADRIVNAVATVERLGTPAIAIDFGTATSFDCISSAGEFVGGAIFPGVFVALDLLVFFAFWEVMLVPMYFIIGIWGGKRRIYATMKFVLFTLAGSLLMFVAILFASGVHARTTGILSFSLLEWIPAASSGAWGLTAAQSGLLFWAFAVAFLVKVPLWPLHTWLPDAHVEAPTGGSIILAGVLLKLGTYGLLRFAIPLFPGAAARYTPLIAVLALVGVVYGAWVAAAQKDMKKLVAYSSVSHLALVVLGIFAGNVTAVSGAVMQMVGHGLTTGLLFLLVGVLYERRHTREMADYGGVASQVPVTTTLFVIAVLGSVGLPGLNGFVGEFLILAGVFKANVAWAAVAATGLILGAIYLLTLVQKVFWGPNRVKANLGLTDINGWEFAGAFPMIVLVVVLGVWPQPVLDLVRNSVETVVQIAAVRMVP